MKKKDKMSVENVDAYKDTFMKLARGNVALSASTSASDCDWELKFAAISTVMSENVTAAHIDNIRLVAHEIAERLPLTQPHNVLMAAAESWYCAASRGENWNKLSYEELRVKIYNSLEIEDVIYLDPLSRGYPVTTIARLKENFIKEVSELTSTQLWRVRGAMERTLKGVTRHALSMDVLPKATRDLVPVLFPARKGLSSLEKAARYNARAAALLPFATNVTVTPVTRQSVDESFYEWEWGRCVLAKDTQRIIGGNCEIFDEIICPLVVGADAWKTIKHENKYSVWEKPLTYPWGWILLYGMSYSVGTGVINIEISGFNNDKRYFFVVDTI